MDPHAENSAKVMEVQDRKTICLLMEKHNIMIWYRLFAFRKILTLTAGIPDRGQEFFLHSQTTRLRVRVLERFQN
ncbi:hypothetical protein NPIL_546941 [Nephila pilipes]|uniref:Uncharacterized protein n=1 Tax=Nephila pilipes TaxID=299642 RepID=A0A8X6QMP6_NEPPI|nr:hypothetical protein NPIL_546941 [Nephila pilipes]